jgi:hypothetical protein
MTDVVMTEIAAFDAEDGVVLKVFAGPKYYRLQFFEDNELILNWNELFCSEAKALAAAKSLCEIKD